MVSDGDKCFRACGIPGGYTESQIRSLLISGLGLDEDVKIIIPSLARNPLRPNEQIATLSFSRVPETLSASGEQHINTSPSFTEDRNHRGRIMLDSHFEGFTPLHNTVDDECCMDIIALSGLNGHSFGSFKAKGGSYMWLRDALPFDLRQARIFIYGYDTNPDKVSFQNVWDLESTFRQRLRILRARSDSTRRPIVIVAHSLGGIIAKAAIVKMAESTIKGDGAAYQSLRGILLFGVPSQGMDIESLIPMMPASEMRALLSSLDKNNSPTLRELGESFPRAIDKLHDFEAFNFYETRESPTAKRSDNGKWEMKGPLTILVTPYSATQGKLADEPGHRVIALARPHSEMIKFSGTNDNDYEITLDCLKEIEERTARESSIRPAHILSSKEKECLQSLSFLEQNSREQDLNITAAEGTCTWILEHENYHSWVATGSRILWILGPPGAGKSTLMKYMVRKEREIQRDAEGIAAFFVHSRGSKMQKSHLGLYRSLLHQVLPDFPGSLATLTEKYEAYKNSRGSFGNNWTWEEEEVRDFFITLVKDECRKRTIKVFIDALDEMGESSAMNLIWDLKQLHSLKSSQELRLWLCFSSRYYPSLVEEGNLSIAVEEENTKDINCLIKTHPALMELGYPGRDTITDLIIERARGIFQWVSLALDQIMHLRRRGQPTTAVIARIMEVPGTLQGLYEDLLTFEDGDDSGQTLKLFQWILFSREPPTEKDLRQALAIDANMTHSTLEEIARSRHYYELTDMEKIVHSLSKGLARLKYDREKNCRWVDTIHQSVDDYLLQRGLERLDPSNSGNTEAIGYFQLSRSCIKLLHLVLQEDPTLRSDDVSLDEDEDNGGLPRFQYHSEKYLNRISQFSLARYAKNWWLWYVTGVETFEIAQKDLLELLPWREKCGYLPIIFIPDPNARHLYGSKVEGGEMQPFRPYSKKWDYVTRWIGALRIKQLQTSWDPVHLLAVTGIHSVLNEMERIEPGIYNRMDRWGQTTLFFALAGGDEKVVASALGALALRHVNDDRLVISPLFIAVTSSNESWVQAIINQGADLDRKTLPELNLETRTPVYEAYVRRDEKMVRQLLAAGADPSAVCDISVGSVTVIHEATRELDVSSRLLLPLLVESAAKLYPEKKLRDTRDCFGGSTLFYAIRLGSVPLVQLLLECGACQDNAYDEGLQNKTAIEDAAARGHVEVVKTLIDDGASINGDTRHRMTPIHYAAANGHGGVVKVLLDHGASLSSGFPNRMTPLQYASANGDASTVELLLHAGVVPNECQNMELEEDQAINTTQDCILRNAGGDEELAGFWSDTKGLRTLHSLNKFQPFSWTARRSYHKMTPLEIAIEKGHTSVVQIFLEFSDTSGPGAQVEAEMIRDMPWDWYIQLAVAYDFPNIIRIILVKSDVDPNIFPFGERSLLHFAVEENYVDLARILLHSGADPTLRDVYGTTVLRRAIEKQHIEIINTLLDWKDAHGRTLVMREISTFRQAVWSALSEWPDRPLWVIREVLLRPEYDFEVQDHDGLNALSYAVIEDMPEVVDLLLDHERSNPNTQNSQGKTALMIAASAGFGQILRGLVAHPLTDIAIEDEDGLTAMDHARRAGNEYAVALLRKQQDKLLVQRQNALAVGRTERGNNWPLRRFSSLDFTGTLRRSPY